jgi:hypothetical protein
MRFRRNWPGEIASSEKRQRAFGSMDSLGILNLYIDYQNNRVQDRSMDT